MTVIMKCDRCAKETRTLYDIPYLVVNPTSKKIEEGYVRGYELCEKCARELIDIINKYKEKGV